jgi:hypothetical protein
MSTLKEWFEQDARKLQEEAKTWPDWMKAGVREAHERARDYMRRKYGVEKETESMHETS